MVNVTKVTPEKMAEALELRRQGHNMTEAARKTGVSRMEWWRTRQQDPEFAQAWNDAYQHAVDDLEDAMLIRALRGTEKVTRTYDRATGNLVREDADTVHDTVLQIFMLKHLRPDTYNPAVKVENTTTVTGEITHRHETMTAPDRLAALAALSQLYDPAWRDVPPLELDAVSLDMP